MTNITDILEMKARIVVAPENPFRMDSRALVSGTICPRSYSKIILSAGFYCGVALCPGTVRSIKATFSRSPCSAGLAYSSLLVGLASRPVRSW